MINIDENLCKGCHLCLYMCDENVYAISSEPNKKGVLMPFVKFEERCTDCGICEVICPDQAISVNIDQSLLTEKGSKWKFANEE